MVLKDDKEENFLREDAIGYLGELKAKEAVPALMEALSKHRRGFSSRAAYSLEQITGRKYDWRTGKEIRP